MKKLLLVSLLVFVTYGMVYSDALLRIISPNGGEGWLLGSEKEIRWWTAERVTNNVKLILFRNGTRVGLIAKDLNPRSGVYTWKKAGQYEGGTAKAGSGYKVVIREQGGTGMDQSDKPFTLLFSGKHVIRPIPIKVTKPERGVTWEEGKIKLICWESVLKPPFKVELYNKSKVLVMECKPTNWNKRVLLGPYQHMMAWIVPAANDEYYIRVSKGAVYGFSEKFKIYDPPD